MEEAKQQAMKDVQFMKSKAYLDGLIHTALETSKSDIGNVSETVDNIPDVDLQSITKSLQEPSSRGRDRGDQSYSSSTHFD